MVVMLLRVMMTAVMLTPSCYSYGYYDCDVDNCGGYGCDVETGGYFGDGVGCGYLC